MLRSETCSVAVPLHYAHSNIISVLEDGWVHHSDVPSSSFSTGQLEGLDGKDTQAIGVGVLACSHQQSPSL